MGFVEKLDGVGDACSHATLEDETGTANAVLTPKAFPRFRVPLQNVDGVAHVRVRQLEPLAERQELPRSHEYR